MPAIAVADALRAEGATVSFIGTRERLEAKLLPEAGYELDFIRVTGISRRNPLRAVAAVGRAARAVGAARRLLRERDADVVLGGGGYVAGPVGYAAIRERLPLILTEADSHLGLANRFLAGRADRVCLAFPIEGREDERYVITGRPIPRTVREADRSKARARFEIREKESCLAAFGGSLGARSINEATLDAFLDGHGADRVLHITGSRDYEEIRARWEKAGSPGHYSVIEYEPHLGDVLAACDLIVARAGGSVFEIAALARPAILVPYEAATGDHQTHNAKWMEENGAAVAIADRDLNPERLRSTVTELLATPERLAEMSAASRRLAKPDAAERIAAEVLRVVAA